MQKHESERTAYLDTQILGETIHAFNRVLEGSGKTIELHSQARIIAILYERFLRAGTVNGEAIEKYVRMIGR